MSFQIAFAYTEECEKEMKDMGFEKREVYIKTAPGVTSKESKQKGDSEFFNMTFSPHQFATTSYWGASND